MTELIFKRMRAAELMDAPGFDEAVDRYWVECANRAMGPANPDQDAYRLMDAAGLSRAVGVFDGERLIGGAILLINNMPHFSVKGAVVESIFVLPEYRRRGVGARLLNELKAMAKAYGCPGVYLSAPVGSRLERLLRLKGIQQTNSVFFEAV